MMNFSDIIYQFLYATALLLCLGVLLMIITKYIREKSKTKKQNFAILEPINSDFVSGIIPIYFEVFYDRLVKIYLTDFDGNEIKIIEEKKYNKGVHQVYINTRDFENGSYFYCIKTNNQTVLKKIIFKN